MTKQINIIEPKPVQLPHGSKIVGITAKLHAEAAKLLLKIRRYRKQKRMILKP
jgi:hypothetical protein